MKNVFGGLSIGCGTLIAIAGAFLMYFVFGTNELVNELPPEANTAAFQITLATPLLMGLGFVAIGVFLIFFVRNPDKPAPMEQEKPVPPEELRRAAPPAQSPQDPQ